MHHKRYDGHCMNQWVIILKWAKENNAPLRDHFDRFPWQMGWLWHHLHDYDECKIEETQMHKMHGQKGWITWCLHLLHEIFEIWHWIDTELTLNWKLLPHLTKKTPIEVKVKSAFDVMDYCFTTTLNCNFELVWVKMCYKLCCKIKNIKHDLWVNTMFPPLQWDELHLKVWSWLKNKPLQIHV